MKPQQIVIITQEFDPHTDAMIVLLRELGHDPIRLHTADFPLQAEASAHYDGAAWQGTIRTPKHTLMLEEIRSIWFRRPDHYRLSPDLTVEEKSFALTELNHALTGVWHGLEQQCYWMSFPPAIRKASYKLSQLQQATRLGLQVPRTLVTSDPEQVYAFYEACNHAIIYKSFFPPPQPPQGTGKLVYTTPMQEEHLARLETLRTAPGIFQEYIPKQIELRVTVIGEEVFAAEIHSQVHAETRYDWRHYEVEMPWFKHTLPSEIAEQVLALTRWYGLNFSASDLILTPDGRYVFLEMNPNGQWLFVQERIPELKMLEALAACLIRGANA